MRVALEESPYKKYAPWVVLFLISIFLSSCSSKPKNPDEIAKQEIVKNDCWGFAQNTKNWSEAAVAKGCQDIKEENLPCFKTAIERNYKPSEAGKFCSPLTTTESDCAVEQMNKNLSFKTIRKKCLHD